MAYKRRAAKPAKSSTRRRSTAARRRSAGPRRAAPRAQTIRIVVEQAAPQQMTLPGMLPEQVGRVVATTPRKAKF